MTLAEKLLRDYLAQTYGLEDPRILKAVKGILSPREQGAIELHASILSGEKLLVVCKRPQRIKEFILIDEANPRRTHRRGLTLKDKENPAEA